MKIELCSPLQNGKEVALFFVNNADCSYISHSELQWGYGEVVADVPKWKDGLLQKVEKELEAMAQNPNMYLYCARENDVLLGFSIFEIITNYLNCTKYAVLQDLVVSKDHRGSGIGKKMLSLIETELPQKGISEIYLESGISNKSAHAFFEKNGFKCVSVTMRKLI